MPIEEIYSDLLLSADEAARLMGNTVGTLAHWRYRGVGPDFVRVNGRTIRYRFQDIRNYIANRLGAENGHPVEGRSTTVD